MIFPYFLRLLCLCLASFFLAHLALGLAARIAAPAAIRLGERMRPRAAARLLLTLRLLPAGLAAFLVAGLCVPSYLWLEPDASTERVGFACCLIALLGVAVWAMSIGRAARAAVRSLRYTRRWRRGGRQARIQGEASPVLVVDGTAPLLALTGVIRSRIVISRGVLEALSPEQLDAALGHEQAHRALRDNLKRLLLLALPGVFPFARGFAALERGWARYAEWAADDQATGGDTPDRLRSLSLAAALVRVARMGTIARPSPLLSCLVADGRELSARVDRLLRAESPRQRPPGALRALFGAAALLVAGFFIAAILHSATFYSVHQLLERLVR